MSSQSIVQCPSQVSPDWPRDPLKYRTEFPHRATLFPLGVPLEVSSNSAEVIAAAKESWGGFPQLQFAEPVHLRIGVGDGDSDELPPPPVFRAQRNLISIVADAQNFAVCDVTGRFAYAWISPATAANPKFSRYHFLETMAGLLLAPVHFAIVHSACVALDGRGVLLCGTSKAGKSTLSFACARRGWTFISDDAVYASRKNPSRTVIGSPTSLRLREDASIFFPELEGCPVILRQNNEMGFELTPSALRPIRTAYTCEVEHVVFLNRQRESKAQLRTVMPDEAFALIDSVLDYSLACNLSRERSSDPPVMLLYDETARAEQRNSIRELLTGGIYELQYANFSSAIDCLESLIRRGA